MSELRDREADICVKEASSRYLPVAELGLSAPSERTFRVAETIPPGYKLTEVGVIPEDWDVMPLAQLTEIRTGIAKNSNVEVGNPVQVYYLRVANVQDGFLDISDLKTLEINRNNIKRYEVLPGDVLMNEGGDLDKLGRGAIWRGEFAPCVHQNHVFVVRCSSRLSPDYLNAWTGGKSARRYFMVAGKQTTNLATINKTALGLLPIVLPTKAEQDAIAEALSDSDALIEALEQLVAKKRQLKQGAMQELLTGKRRLPGFETKLGVKNTEIGTIPIDWEYLQIADFIDLLTGFPFPSSKYSLSGIRLLRGSNVKRGITDWSEDGTTYWPAATLEIKKYLLKSGDIVIAMDGSLVGRSFAMLSDSDLPALLLQRVARIRSAVIDQKYLKEWICSQKFTEHCDAVKTVTAIPHISPADIRSFQITIPPTKTEQTAIAQILSDMDAEIATLETKLTKARAVKQGMMQQLLTGKIRLVVNPKPIIDN